MNSSSPKSIGLIHEILSRLPSKSVARFRCVSKPCASMIGSPYFTELFLTRSLAKPRLLFATVKDGVWSFFSSPYYPYEKSSSTFVATAKFHVKFPPNNIRIGHNKDRRYFSYGYTSGLIYLYGDTYDDRPVICNPYTGEYAILPYLKRYRKAYSFLVFEPIDKQFKVLFMAYQSGCDRNHKILTVGTGNMKWRTIKFSLGHEIASEGITINGVLSEKFTFFEIERFCRLINYKGKLAMIYFEDDVNYQSFGYRKEDYVEANDINELHVWVLEDMEKQKWSKYAYTWTDDIFFRRRHVSVAPTTAWGEIVFSMCEYTPGQPFYVFYFNPEKNTLQRVEIQGFGEAFCSVYTFVDNVEDLNVNDLKILKPFNAPFVKKKESESDYSNSDSE
ncbi:F-box associated domain type 3 [Arabidopsis suecica]|uniref:F-box associated domain type 3 n=1 Tax=Arabidopsis suecica TaxID=45249 RepID=A0A8T2AGN0_ARASU|nr:F-box associated domain type 3 [Arabidopsis suecica]